jgi:YHS domain-containing protein
MTAQRRELIGRCRGFALIVLLAVLPAAGRAGTTERVVADRFTGLAIAGFDPVAYFTDARPLPGDAAYELSEEGVVWRFRNESNRASFAAHPEIYGPQFGGYDPVDVARGVAYPGNPQLWLVVNQRLYLFGREDSRDAFAAAPAAVLAEARKRWTVLRSELSR